MAKRQEQFNAQMEKATEAIGTLTQSFDTLTASVESERQQIADFIASLPEDVDTSALDGVVANLEAAVAKTEGLSERVNGIFSTGEQTQTVTTDGETEQVPVEELNLNEDVAGNTSEEVPSSLEPVGEASEFPTESGVDAEVTAGGENGTVGNSEGSPDAGVTPGSVDATGTDVSDGSTANTTNAETGSPSTGGSQVSNS